MALLLVTSDLMMQSRIAGAAERVAGEPLRVTTARGLPAPTELADCRLAMVDLSTDGLEVAKTIGTLRESLPIGTPVIAFGPHVHKNRLNAAREAGCNLVVSRGRFDRELDTLLHQMLGTGSEGGTPSPPSSAAEQPDA